MSIFLGKCQWLDDGVRQKLYTHNFYVNCNVSLDVKTLFKISLPKFQI